MPPPRPSQHGMILPALLLLVGLSGLGWLLARHDNAAEQAARSLAQDLHTARSLAMARQALLGYAAAYRENHSNADYGYLPCPDLDGDGSAETCGIQGSAAIGRLPYLTLNLPELRDGSGSCLWYAVSGNVKNNPKPPVLNWNSSGSFRILDTHGKPTMQAGDPMGLAAALIIAPGPPLPGQQRSPGTGRCESAPSPHEVETYIEALALPLAGGEIPVRTASPETNDRLRVITVGDIYLPLKSRSTYAKHLQYTLQALADCLVQSGLPAPLNPSPAGPVQIGKVPAPTQLNGPCRAEAMRDPVSNWLPLTLYARCTQGDACLTSGAGHCRGALLFGGERLMTQAYAPDGAGGAYLEASTLSALAGGLLGAPSGTITLPYSNRHSPASQDVAFCLP